MRYLLSLLLLALCSGCALIPHEIEQATVAQNHAVVFDIDGTLTTKVHAIRTPRDGAAEAVRAFADGGYLVVYLTARLSLFQWHIPGWLERHGFPDGRIHVTQSRDDRKHPESFKQRVLEAYTANGWTLVAAYGDSSTDFEAYANAGLPRNRVFALKCEGAEACQAGAWAGCYATWPEQMERVHHLIQSLN